MEEKTNTFENPSVNTNTYNSDLDQKLVQIMSELQKQTEILRSIDTKRLSENVEAKEETKESEISEVPATDEMTLDPISFPDDQLPVEPVISEAPVAPTGDVPEEQPPVYPTESSVPVPTDVSEPSAPTAAPTEPVVPTLPEIPTEEPVVEEPVLNPVLEQTMELPTEEIKEDNNVIGIDELLSEVPTNELPAVEEIKPDVEIAPVAEPVAAQVETQEITWPTAETNVVTPTPDVAPVEPTIIDKPEQITVEPTPVVAPATPVAPTAPVEPVQPVQPAMPVEPVAPVAPVVPAEPVIPQTPVETNNVELVPNPFGEGSVVKAEGKQRSVEVDNTKINGKEEAEEIKPAVKTLSNNQ